MTKGAKAVVLVLGGGDVPEQTLWLQYDVDKLILLEELLDLDAQEISERLSNNRRLGLLRAVFWAGLQEHQPNIALKAAGEMLLWPNNEAILPTVLQAFVKAFPNADAEAASGASDPPTAPASDGSG